MSVFRIDCGYQNYDWGKVGPSSAVAQFASASNPATTIDDKKPYAELWMGTHPSVPSTVVSGDKAGQTLRELVAENPTGLLHSSVVEKFGPQLPFLFKVLSIEKVLSIQAHPDKALAKQLHANDPKNYPDDNHKPEMAIAVTLFEGFCGFKPLTELATTLKTVPELSAVIGDELVKEFCEGVVPDAKLGSQEDSHNRKLLQKVFGKLMNTDEGTIKKRAAELVERTKSHPEVFTAISPKLPKLIQSLNRQFPDDIGLFCGCLLLNHVVLSPGEAMFLQAKDPHAYINGDIIECMAASDNVVRAGFTPKFKDVKNLVEMLTYSYDSVEKQKMPLLAFDKASGQGKSVLYNPPIDEFAVLQTTFTEAKQTQHFEKFNGPSILIATKGLGSIVEQGAKQEVKAGYVYFVAPGTEVDLVSADGDFTTYRAFVEV